MISAHGLVLPPHVLFHTGKAYRPSTGLPMAALLAILIGLSKARFGTYIPPLKVEPGKYLYDYDKLEK